MFKFFTTSQLTMLRADRPKPDTTDDERREASPE
jgi:hypothetical protein